MTDQQKRKVRVLAEAFGCKLENVVVNPGGFGLPDGWVVACIYDTDDRTIRPKIIAGISPEGDAHT